MLDRERGMSARAALSVWVRLGWLVCFVLALLRLSPSALAVSLLGGGVAVGLFFLRARGALWCFLGLSTLLVPIAGDGALLALAFLVLALAGQGEMYPQFARPFLLVVVANLIGALVVTVLVFHGGYFGGGGISNAFEVVRASARGLARALSGFLHVVGLVGIFSALKADESARRDMLYGIAGGAVLSLALILGSLFIPELITLPNTNDFWRSLKRHPGTFTDPNAFGVAAVLLVALLLEMRVRTGHKMFAGALALLAFGWAVVPLVSGSRSFFIGVGALAALGIFSYSRRLFALIVCLVGVGIGLLQSVVLPLEGLPVGLERLLQSLQLDRVGESFYSRAVFWRIGGEIFGDHPWYGVGLGAFPAFVEPYAHRLGIPLHGWIDNANSYYLGILAELGLIGGLAWLISAAGLRWDVDGPHGVWCRRGVLALLIMLVVGPHLDFDEVTVLGAVCFAGALGVPRWASSKGAGGSAVLRGIVGLLVVSGVLVSHFAGERGVYPMERDAEGRYRWTTPRAVVRVPCRGGEAVLVLRGVHPDIARNPLDVTIKSPSGSIETSLTSAAVSSFTLPCGPKGSPQWTTPSSIPLNLVISRGWIPSRALGGGDHRLLGVQVRELEP